jgi:phosphocarrier protein
MAEVLIESIEIVNKLGLHARAAAKFVKIATEFKSEITLSRGGETVNGKSIMGILMLAAEKGSSITLKIEGEDQEQAFAVLKKLIMDGFGE